MRGPRTRDGVDLVRTCDYRIEFSRNLRHRQKGLLRSFRNRARYAFTGQDGRADRAEDDGTMADMQLQNGGRFLFYALGKQALSAFSEQQNNWDKLEQQIAKNLKEEIALYSADPVSSGIRRIRSIYFATAADNRRKLRRALRLCQDTSIDNLGSIG